MVVVKPIVVDDILTINEPISYERLLIVAGFLIIKYSST